MKKSKQKLKFTTTRLYSYKNPKAMQTQDGWIIETTPITTTVTAVITLL